VDVKHRSCGLSVRIGSFALAIVSAAFGTALAQPAPAQSTSQDVIAELAPGEGIFVDGKTFKIARGKAKGDPAEQVARLGAKEIGPGTIIFRSGDKLYIVGATPGPTPQSMQGVEDNANAAYANALKNFQDSWSASYAKQFAGSGEKSYMSPKDFETNQTVYMNALKEFQDGQRAQYMKAVKNFQDNWNKAYMKDFQDNWNTSYMNALKNFQDNWATSYLK
jgi:hypothetical protein